MRERTTFVYVLQKAVKFKRWRERFTCMCFFFRRSLGRGEEGKSFTHGGQRSCHHRPTRGLQSNQVFCTGGLKDSGVWLFFASQALPPARQNGPSWRPAILRQQCHRNHQASARVAYQEYCGTICFHCSAATHYQVLRVVIKTGFLTSNWNSNVIESSDSLSFEGKIGSFWDFFSFFEFSRKYFYKIEVPDRWILRRKHWRFFLGKS